MLLVTLGMDGLPELEARERRLNLSLVAMCLNRTRGDCFAVKLILVFTSLGSSSRGELIGGKTTFGFAASSSGETS